MNKCIGGICAISMLVDLAFAAAARAQDATWNGSTSDFNAAGNWVPTAVPTGTAFFGSAGLSDIHISAGAVLGGITFDAAARAFTFSTTTETAGMALVGAGIVNNSSMTPAFRISNGGAVSATPGLAFLNVASAGNAAIVNTDGGVTAFLDNSTAGNASIVNTAGSAFFSGTVFIGSSTAGNAFITNGTGGITQFNPSASAGGATIINQGGTIGGFSIARFVDALTNPAVGPTASEVGATAFVGSATAGTATIVNNSGGVTAFLGASTAGSATIIANAGGATFFTGASSGGTANLVVNAGGVLDLSVHVLGSMAAGSLTLAAGGSYRIGVTAAGQSNAMALSGAAALLGGTVEIVAMTGTYVPNTAYTIVTASQGVTGSFAGVIEDFAFLTPMLSYDANNVHLSLVLGPGAFASAGQTVNQQAIGGGLDAIAASGNLGGIVTALASLGTSQGAPALQALSPEAYADFGTVNIRSSQLFSNAVGRQMAGERSAAVGAPRSAALAETRNVACDDSTPRRFSAWLSGIGSTGSVPGDGNASGLTYTLGGTAFGIDWRIDPRFLIGIAGGWVGGSQWANGFGGNGYTGSLSVALYGSFTRGAFYADALAGYANSSNRLQRVIAIAGQSAAVASGETNVNQFLGQLETGYKVRLPFPANASISPFARLQVGSANQAGFTESGSSLFNLSVAQQTTTSVRTIFGADFGASFDLGGGQGGGARPLDIGLRLGWMHELADTARPISAAFAAAPVQQFTVYGATPRRDSAVIGFSATAAVTDSASLFAAYDGEVGGGTDNHALRVGFRLTW